MSISDLFAVTLAYYHNQCHNWCHMTSLYYDWLCSDCIISYGIDSLHMKLASMWRRVLQMISL